MQRYQRFMQLPPEQRQKVLNNYQRWKQMSPEQRQEFSRQWGRTQSPHPRIEPKAEKLLR